MKQTLKIIQDCDPENPRVDFDNLGTFAMFHRHYAFGDKHATKDIVEAKLIEARKSHYICLPVYMYDHSGQTISTTPFSCPWDSGQIGIIYVHVMDVRKEFSVKRVSKKLREKVLHLLRGEIETLDQWLTGDVYGFELYETHEVPTGDGVELQERLIDSCFGFYGSDPKKNGMDSYVNLEEISEVVYV